MSGQTRPGNAAGAGGSAAAATEAFVPQLIGIGFPKAGTTFIARRLGEHPNIRLASRKETHFWERPERDFDVYRNYFEMPDIDSAALKHEWTVGYIYSETALQGLATHAPPGTQFLVAFRDPVDAFFSNYNYRRMINHSNLERKRPPKFFFESPDEHSTYVERYFYDTHYARFRRFLPDHRAIVIDYACLSAQPDLVFRQLYQQFGLPYHAGHLQPGRENPSISPKSLLADRALRKALRMIYGDPGPIYRADFRKKPKWVALLQWLNSERYIYDEQLAERLRDLHAGHLTEFLAMVRRDPNTVLIDDGSLPAEPEGMAAS